MLCFIAEVLGNQIRSNQNISGVTISNIEQKILQYADDTQIMVSNNSSINEVFKQLRLYEEATGSKIKLDFLEMVKEVQNTNNLGDSQKKGVIHLIFKKEGRSDLKFYRPISLLNADVKIITKTPCSPFR